VPAKPFAAYEGKEPYVFVCYAHRDAGIVYPQIIWLREQGVNIWYDEGIEAGTVWRRRLAEAIEGAAKLVFYVSGASIESANCHHEVDYAVDHNVEVLPVYLEEVQLPPELSMVLNRVQALHPADDPDFAQRLLQFLNAAPKDNVDTGPRIGQQPSSAERGFIKWLLGGAVLTVVVVAILWFTESQQERQSAPDAVVQKTEVPDYSIAVLPPTVIGGSPGLSRFAEILPQDLKEALSKFQKLTIMDAQSATGSRYTLGSTIRETEETIRLSFELKRTSDGVVLWSKRLEEPVDLWEASEFPRAAYVAYTVHALLDYAGYRSFLEDYGITDNQEALNAFFAGMLENEAARVGDGNFRLALEHLRTAAKLDPEFTDAYAMQALIYGFRGQGQLSLEEALTNVQVILPRLATLPGTPMVALALVYVNLRLYLDYDGAEKYLKMIESTPASPPHQTHWLRCSILYGKGRINEALDHCAASAEASGGSLERYTLGVAMHLAGRHREAVQASEQSLEIADSTRTDSAERGVHNNGGHLLDMLASSQALIGDAKSAAATIDSDFARQLNWFPKQYATSLVLLDRLEEAEQALQQQDEGVLIGEKIAPGARFWTHYYMGDMDQAFYWARQAIENRAFMLIGVLKSSPSVAELRDDPRFDELMLRVQEIEASGGVP
jgi:TolB-like protein